MRYIKSTIILMDANGTIKKINVEYYGRVNAFWVFYETFEVEFGIAPIKWI